MPEPKRLSALLLAGTCAVALMAASPVGPCEEVTYVGQCVPIGGHQTPPVQYPYGEFALAPDSGATNSIG